MNHEQALAQARTEAAPLGPLHAKNMPGGEHLLAPRVRELMDAARQQADRERYAEQARNRRDYAESHSPEWHAHQRSLASMGANARCQPGCLCEEEPW